MLGVARSRFASVAVDHVCAQLHLPYFQTAELWADLSACFGAENVTLAGNSQGEIGGAHSREADGLWALLFWLNILASKSATVESLLLEHWHRFGRNYHGHYHYPCSAHQLLRWTTLTESLSHLNWRGKLYGPYEIAFTQLLPSGGYELGFTDGSRLLFCPEDHNPGASFHLYLERYEPPPATQELTPAEALKPLLNLAQELLAYPSAP
jgi:phosphoglucomutase